MTTDIHPRRWVDFNDLANELIARPELRAHIGRRWRVEMESPHIDDVPRAGHVCPPQTRRTK